MYVENVPNVITAACVLHNICETHHEHFNEEWMQSSNEEYEQPITKVASSYTCNYLTCIHNLCELTEVGSLT